LTAEFLDYTDADNARIFRGAEKSDYRFFNKSPPTNSPIRNITEISKLLSMPENLGSEYWDNFAFITVTRAKRSIVQPAFAIPAIREAFKAEDLFGNIDFRDEIAQQDLRPLNQARFLLTIPGSIPLSRAIEIEKRVNDVQKPFRRTLISERAGLDGKKLFDAIASNGTQAQELSGDNGGSDLGIREDNAESEFEPQDVESPIVSADVQRSDSVINAEDDTARDNDPRGGVNEYPRIFTTRP